LSTSSSREQLDPAWLVGQRWFRAKTRQIEDVRIADEIPVANAGAIVIVRVHYAERDSDLYQLPPLSQQAFRRALLEAIQSGATLAGNAGELIASPIVPFTPGDFESSVSGAEQSNTSIIYGDQFILKLFRKLEPGVNPDLEIGRFLTEHGFRHTPAVFGSLEYRATNGEPYTAGILQQFVPNRGDAWKFTLEELAAFFSRDTPDVGSYARSAELLGRRTAEMHAALASDDTDPAFAPEPFTLADAAEIERDMIAQADITFNLLRRSETRLDGATGEMARPAVALEPAVRERLHAVRTHHIDTPRIRLHGDFHLGQVLHTGDDFVIIDFEGEPARALSERRGKGLALRDVAGMLRSFSYAAAAAQRAHPQSTQSLQSKAASWTAEVTDLYLRSYFESAANSAFTPPIESRRVFLDAFVLQKALYEIAYELNNRPDWVEIPLRGVLELIR